MKISEYMTVDPIAISSATLLPEARQLLNEYQIRHLPVIDHERKLIGIVSDRDLRSAYPSTVIPKPNVHLDFERIGKTAVEDIMTTNCATLSPDASIDDALLIFDRDKVGVIPIVSEEGVVIGIFSLLDLTSAYKKLFGVAEEGSVLIGINDDGRENILSQLVLLLDSNNIALTRLMHLQENGDEGKVYMRINTPRPVEVYKLLKNSGFSLVEA